MIPDDKLCTNDLFQGLGEKNKLPAGLAETNEAYYHTLFTRMNIGFQLCEILCDPSGTPRDYRFLETNEFFEKETGIICADIRGKTALELFPDLEPTWIQNYGKVALTGESAQFECFSHNTGRWYEVFAFSPARGQFAALGKDITGRRQAEVKLKNSEERYRALFMSLREGFFLSQVVRDANGDPCDFRYLEINPAFEAIIGLDRKQLIGRRLKELFPDYTPVWMEIFRQVALTGTASYCSYFSEPFQRYFEVYAFKLGEEQVAVLVSDVTQQRLSDHALREREAGLRLFIEHAPASIAMFDRDMIYLAGSRRWSEAHLLGAGDLTGKCHYDILPEIGAEWREAHRRGLAGEVLRSDGDRFERGDGSVQWMRWEIQPWRDRSGAVGGIVIFAEDITPYRELQDALLHSNEQLEKKVQERTAELELTVQELETFSYSVSHDLRAPLRHINSFSAMLIEDLGEALPAKGHQYLERIAAASNRMGALIDHLLKLSTVSRTEIRLEAVDLSRLATSIMRLFQETEPGRRVEFVVRQELKAVGDRTLLRQLLENLLENAWKYTSRKSSARIELGRMVKDGREVYFVRDNGAGFDMAYQKKLFSSFERLHGSEFEGLGIGLATARKIVERHGGAIWAEGEVDRGATFYFTLAAESR